MASPRSSSTEAARERRRQKGEAQAVTPPSPVDMNQTVATGTIASAAEQEPPATTEEGLPFDQMIKRELDHVMDLQIKEALNKMMKRQTALMSQESSITDEVRDELGHDADWYEDLVLAVQNKDPRVGETKDEIYQFLYDLKFTEMRSLEALHEMYPVSSEEPKQEQVQEQVPQEQKQEQQ